MLNVVVVIISNLVMAGFLCRQLATIGIPPKHTLALWLIVLNIAGAFWFIVLGATLF